MDFEEAEKLNPQKEQEVGLEEETNTPPIDRFTELMFGSRSSSRNQENTHQHRHSNQDDNQTDEISYFSLMEQIDDIMVSLENLKPMLKQFSPIMDYIKKKI